MGWGIQRIVNGCAAQQLVARRDVIAPEFIQADAASRRGLIQACVPGMARS